MHFNAWVESVLAHSKVSLLGVHALQVVGPFLCSNISYYHTPQPAQFGLWSFTLGDAFTSMYSHYVFARTYLLYLTLSKILGSPLLLGQFLSKLITNSYSGAISCIPTLVAICDGGCTLCLNGPSDTSFCASCVGVGGVSVCRRADLRGEQTR